MRGLVRELIPAFAEGRLESLIDRVFPFAELPQAKRYLESNGQVGKIVISVA